MPRTHARFTHVCLALIALGIMGCSEGSDGSRNSSLAGVEYRPVPGDYGYPVEAAQLERFISENDRREIRIHAWNVWAAITSPSGELQNGKELPVWETWYSMEGLYGPGTPACAAEFEDGAFEGRDLGRPTQHFHGTNPDGDEAVTSINRFTAEVVDHVCRRGYNEKAVLDDLNDSFTARTPVVDRAIESFPTRAIALKPVFRVVRQSEVTIQPYWLGSDPSQTSNPVRPGPDTWKQCVAVVPPGVTPPPSPVVAPCNDVPSYPAEVISIERFYYFQITQAEVDAATDADLGDDTPVAGDYIILVGMHVTTKELPEWTWQTFWWTPFPDEAPYGDFRPSVVANEWRNYHMCTAWVYTGPPETPTGPPEICFNPYLETDLPDIIGKESNCKTCHSLAAWPNFSTDYQANGYIDLNDAAVFGESTRVDFLWSVTNAD